jgi:phosphate-selective porin
VDPRRSLLAGGPGAIEVATRVERLAFRDVTHPGTVFENPRPEGLAGNAERVVTIGLTWYLHRYVKLQGNLVIEEVDDPQRSPAPRANGRFPSGVVLLQFAL